MIGFNTLILQNGNKFGHPGRADLLGSAERKTGPEKRSENEHTGELPPFMVGRE